MVVVPIDPSLLITDLSRLSWMNIPLYETVFHKGWTLTQTLAAPANFEIPFQGGRVRP
jgi:hypothetical protein